MAFDVTTWMPPGMDQTAKDYWAAEHPDDPHMAAAAAWESWAATLAAEPGVDSIQTGAQSIRYARTQSAYSDASARARWHRARSRVRSVESGPLVEWGYLDVEAEQVIETYDSPARPVVRGI